MLNVLWVILVLVVGSAQAEPLTWTLNSVTTSDGASWTGTFDYDDVSNTYSAINIVSSVSGFPNPVDTVSTDAFLTVGCTDPATADGVTLGFNAEGVTIFCMDFASSLSNIGGTVNLVTGGIGWGTLLVGETITGGSVTGVAFPGPILTSVEIEVDGWVNHANTYHPQHNKELHASHDGTGNAQNDPVAVVIYGTVDFDASNVNGATLRFGPANAEKTATALGIQELTGDIYIDATAEFLMSDLGLDPTCADTELILTGETLTGEPFGGTDTDFECSANATCH
jgi:hypothetical protein